MTTPVPAILIETILPHRGTMLLIDAISSFDDDALTACTTVHANAWYADDHGAMPAWIGIELMAQAIAAHVALLAMRDGNKARPGVLLGTSSYRAHQTAFARDTALRIHVMELLRGEEGHGAYECSIECAGTHAAEAVVKVFQPTDFNLFIDGSID